MNPQAAIMLRVSTIFLLASFTFGFPAQSQGRGGGLATYAIAWDWKVADGKFQNVSIEDKLNGVKIPLNGECFQVVVCDGTILKASDFKLIAPPKIEMLPESSSPVAATNYFAKQLVVKFSAPEKNLSAEWRVIARAGSTYLRQELALHAEGGDVPVKEIVLFNQKLFGAKTVGAVDGSPVVARHFFFGYEHPMSQNLVDSNSVVRCSFLRNAILKNGETLTQSCVMGVTRAGQLRRDFLAYIERERAHQYRPFLHYNSWYDIHHYNETQCVSTINQLGEELTVKRGVPIASFLFDDGWDDTKTLWKFHSSLPNGFTPLREEAEKYHSALGVWISPFGGYGGVKQQRLKFGSAEGFETNASGFSLSGTNYYTRFHDICAEMIQKYGVNEFKFDGLAAGAKAGEEGLTRDGDAMLRMVGALRAIRPDLYINQTVGTWPSPFWLLYVDSTWRGSSDHNFFGKGSDRQRWITYRDMITYSNVVQRAPLYPLNSLMLHGIIYGKLGKGLTNSTDGDFRDEVREYFGTGTQLQELYLTPKLLNQTNWDDLAEAAKWSRENSDVLVDTHWIGGNPGADEIYGWASWSPRKVILVLRNPDDKPATIILDAEKVFELPTNTQKRFLMHSPWKEGRGQPNVNLRGGKPHEFKLNTFEVLVLESK